MRVRRLHIVADAAPKSSRLAWYPHFPGNWLAETQGWPLIARGIFRELLDAQWNMGVLPSDPARLRSLVGATATQWRTARPFIETKFPIADR